MARPYEQRKDLQITGAGKIEYIKEMAKPYEHWEDLQTNGEGNILASSFALCAVSGNPFPFATRIEAYPKSVIETHSNAPIP